MGEQQTLVSVAGKRGRNAVSFFFRAFPRISRTVKLQL